jgi:flavin-dependent dehydrogenase
MKSRYDIAVVGGGVAGIVAAQRCSNYGFKVALFVDGRSSPHALQSTHPTMLDTLADIGIAQFAGRCLVTCESKVDWGTTQATEERREPALLLDRAEFDAALMESCDVQGLDVLSDPNGYEWSFSDSGHCRVRAKNHGTEYACDYLINATGKLQPNPRTLVRQSNKTLALRAQWEHSLQERAVTYIHAFDSGWYWGATLGNKSNLNVFLAPDIFKQARRNALDLQAMFEAFHCNFSWRSEMPALSRPNVDVLDATSYLSADPIDQRMVNVGASAIRIDPLSSQGIQVSITTAVQASIAINTLVKKPKHGDEAITFYRERLRQRSDMHAFFQSHAYADAGAKHGTAFWLERMVKMNQQLGLSPIHEVNYYLTYCLSNDTSFDCLPAISGDFVEPVYCIKHPSLREPSFIRNAGTFRRALKHLSQMPLMMVLNHPSYKVCRNELEQLFHHLVSYGVLEPQMQV